MTFDERCVVHCVAWPLITEPGGDGRTHRASLSSRFRAKREHRKRFQRPEPVRQGQNLALTVLDVPHSLDIGWVRVRQRLPKVANQRSVTSQVQRDSGFRVPRALEFVGFGVRLELVENGVVLPRCIVPRRDALCILLVQVRHLQEGLGLTIRCQVVRAHYPVSGS